MEKERIQLEKNTRTIQQRNAGSANIMDNRPGGSLNYLSGTSLQRVSLEDEEEEPVQGKMSGTAQRVEGEEDDEDVLQGKMADPVPKNETGLPDNLKAGVESLSGYSLDDVRVHYNSSKPATVQALAYTQGTDIHVAPGQERHLPHEAWHVAQQMAGRVAPTTNINGMPVNDNAALEHEADVMGEKAVQCKKLGKRPLSYNCNSQDGVSQLTTLYVKRGRIAEKIVINQYGELIRWFTSNSKAMVSIGREDDPSKVWAGWSRELKKQIKERGIEIKIKKDDLLSEWCDQANINKCEDVESIIGAVKAYNDTKPPIIPKPKGKALTEANKWKEFIKSRRKTECGESAERCAWVMSSHKKTSGGGTDFKIDGKTIFHCSHGPKGEIEKCCTVFFIHDETKSGGKWIVGVGHHVEGMNKTASYKLNWHDPSWIVGEDNTVTL